jgi:hypothetical protein
MGFAGKKVLLRQLADTGRDLKGSVSKELREKNAVILFPYQRLGVVVFEGVDGVIKGFWIDIQGYVSLF